MFQLDSVYQGNQCTTIRNLYLHNNGQPLRVIGCGLLIILLSCKILYLISKLLHV